MQISVSVEINKPKKNVWSAITNIEQCPQFISAIIGLEVLHKPAHGLVGLKWTETRKMFGKEASETMWITECANEEYYCTRAENHGAIYLTRMSVADQNGGSTLTMSFSGTAENFLVRMISSAMGVLIKKSMTKMLQQDLSDIKLYVESAD